jgi:hypothetical protein
MSILQRFNEKTGRKEFFIEVEGIPGGYWTTLGLCDRCYTYKKCLGLAKLSEEEFQEFENSSSKLLDNINETSCCENLT